MLGSEPRLRGLLSSRLQCSHGQVALDTLIGIGVPRVPGAFHTTGAIYTLSERLQPEVRSHSLKVGACVSRYHYLLTSLLSGLPQLNVDSLLVPMHLLLNGWVDIQIESSGINPTCWRVTSGCVGDELEKTQVIQCGDQFPAFCSIWVVLEPTGHSAIQVADQHEGVIGVVKVSADSGMESMEKCFTLGRFGMRGL